MKRKLIIVVLFTFAFCLFTLNAQSPNLMSYQAMVRDAGGNLVCNSQVGMRISIVQGAPDGTDVYVEEYTVTTNTNGLVSIEIGSGSQDATNASLKNAETTVATIVGGDFSAIDWSDGPYFLKVETDPTGGTNYTITGTSQLLSVPYAKYADKASNVKFTDGDNSDDAVYTKGDVGVGTTSPLGRFDVATSGWSNPFVVSNSTYGHTNIIQAGDGLLFKNSHATGSNVAYGFRNSSDIHIMDIVSNGNVGIGTSEPQAPLHIKTNSAPALIISSSIKNDPSRPGIRFSNNTSQFISGDDLSDELFGFYSIWANARTYDAKLRVYGKATGSWGTYIELTHDGTNGSIRTDVGDINMFPAGEVSIDGDLNVTGKISGAIDTINVSQITGILGQGYSAVFPQVLDNTTLVEIEGVYLTEDVVIVSSIGTETDRISVNLGVDGNGNPIYSENAGLTMEFPLIIETSNSTDIQSLKNWFDQADPASKSVSVIIPDLAGNETGRWNLYDYKPDVYAAGSDDRTKFTLIHDGVPDNVNTCVYLNDFGLEHSFNPETDKLVEIQGVSTGTDFTPAVEVNTQDRTITLTIDYNESYKLYDWVKETIAGTGSGKSMSVIETTDGTPSTETGRYNYFNCIPIKYEHFYGFGLNVKLKARLVIAYGIRAEG